MSKHLDAMLSSSDCVGLYVKVLELIRFDLETPEFRGLTTKVKSEFIFMIKLISFKEYS